MPHLQPGRGGSSSVHKGRRGSRWLQRGRAALPLVDSLNYRRRISGLGWLRRAVVFIGLPLAIWWWPHPAWVFGVCVTAFILYAALHQWEQSLRRQFIRDGRLPSFLIGKLCAEYPQLKPREAELVLHGLRQFFMAHLGSDRKFVAMPSRIVDSAWHEFILHTRGHEVWCRTAFGHLLHHSPAEVLGKDARRNDGLRRCWYWACKEESIDARKPARLPLLFALDRKFAVPGGFCYVPDCNAVDRHAGSDLHCGTTFGGGCVGDDAGGFGGSESSGGDGSCGGN